jgi:fluoride exporter
MSNLLVLALGGALGTLARYGVNVASAQWVRTWSWSMIGDTFPAGTVIVNLGGTFIIALLATWAEIIGTQAVESHTSIVITPTMRLLLITGFCGGFTTFSSLMLDCVQMFESRSYIGLGVYLILSTAGAAFCFWLGSRVAQAVM